MDEIDRLGALARDDDPRGSEPDPGGRRESRRTVLALAAASGLGTLAVVVAIWMISFAGGPGDPDVGDARAGSALGASGSTGSADPAVDTSPSSTAPGPGDLPTDAGTPTTLATTPAAPVATVPAPTLDLPPPEQPTFTATDDPSSTPSTPPPPPSPTTAPGPRPAPTTSAPPRSSPPVVSDVVLTCRLAGDQTRARLTFTTTGPVDVWLQGGGKVVTGTRGPGAVSLDVRGSRSGYCLATVGQSSYGPVPAS